MTLDLASFDYQERIRIASAEDTSVTDLRELAADPSSLVRGAVAANPITPRVILLSLAEDHKPTVIEALKSNPAVNNLVKIKADLWHFVHNP
jgi:hypothetical protein